MGVKGLWSLLNPVARPVQIESMEGKRLAIDSSIWLYQFQATMRDKDGRVLVNAHVLGFLRRINKLLFHGIKPVFVFDGGAPVLKRATIGERKRRKAGAAANHARMAERLFAAQMRREAVKVAQSARDEQTAREAARDAVEAATRYDDDAGEQVAENAIYLEDLEGRPGPSRPRTDSNTAAFRPAPAPADDEPDAAELRRRKFKKHDPYRLPEATIPSVSTEDKPDARLATEEELKQFIDEMQPEDIDVDSAEFRALPTEVQYEIIGDLRIRSRQQSHRRLVDMLRAAPSALDFSMAQIKHLSQRNALTQQLLTVTDMVGKAHLTIPVRIAAERNREYVLVKRGENEGGGWALGIREGTKANPIKVDPDEKQHKSESEESEESEEESDVEEVPAPVQQSIDPDLREHRRREMLEALAARYTTKKPPKPSLDLAVKPFGNRRPPGAAPLFEDEEAIVPSANDEALALALQQEELGSDEDQADEDLARALAQSRSEAETSLRAKSEAPPIRNGEESDDTLEEVSLVPSSRSTPQPLSGDHTPLDVIAVDDDEDDFDEIASLPIAKNAITRSAKQVTSPKALRNVDSALQEVKDSPRKGSDASTGAKQPSLIPKAVPSQSPPPPTRQAQAPTRQPSATEVVGSSRSKPVPSPARARPGVPDDGQDTPGMTTRPPLPSAVRPSAGLTAQEVQPSPSAQAIGIPSPARYTSAKPNGKIHPDSTTPSSPQALPASPSGSEEPELPGAIPLWSCEFRQPLPPPIRPEKSEHRTSTRSNGVSERNISSRSTSTEQSVTEGSDLDMADQRSEATEDEEDSCSIAWSRSPSSAALSRPPLQTEQSGEAIPSEVEDEEADMAREDMVAEEDDYARFMAQIKNRDLNEVRTEIDDEIRVLNSQNKVAMRDSDEITQAMIAQIQTLLRHFGIPYITAPMEAEAQCAKLAELNLVDGIITDDSDVFLFGGKQCFKNIFNDAKYAECFLLTDIDRELSLTRERLISLAYLLGSDYTIGLPGVGPVVALELLANFPGPTGIADFKTWWTKVQRGQDTEVDSEIKWKKTFKKRYSSLIFIQADWPNHLVREAYKYPTTDESEEPFHWGFPKLSALRSYLHEELSWSISKVDDELTPIVQRIARRGKVGALNKQATLDPFFDLSIGQGNYAPRRRTTANVSKRLMGVIKQYREAEARVTGQQPEGWGTMMVDLDEEDPKGRGTGKRRKSKTLEEEGGDTEEDSESVPKRRKSESRAKLKRAASSATISEMGTESVGSSVGAGEDVNQRGRRKRTASVGRGRGRGRGRAPSRTQSGEVVVE